MVKRALYDPFGEGNVLTPRLHLAHVL